MVQHLNDVTLNKLCTVVSVIFFLLCFNQNTLQHVLCKAFLFYSEIQNFLEAMKPNLSDGI